jgi:hypothetical protein
LTALAVVQIASTVKIVSTALCLLMVTYQKSGTDPLATGPELRTVTAGSTGGVKLPPPITTIPPGSSLWSRSRRLEAPSDRT